jgi:hypothetical protein
MEYTIEKLADLEIIKVTLDGRLNHLERKDIYPQAIYELNRNGYNRLLFDVSKLILSSGYTDDKSIEMSHFMKEFEVPKNTKLAFLNTSILLTQTTFLAIANAINEDMDIRLFTNYGNAINWLVGTKSYEINWEKNGVHVRFWDTFDYNANVNANIDLYKDPRCNYITYAIWDTSKITEYFLTEDELNLIAGQGRGKSLSVPKIKMAFFAPDKNLRSICEQCCAYCQSRQASWEFMVSDSMKSIRDWVAS